MACCCSVAAGLGYLRTGTPARVMVGPRPRPLFILAIFYVFLLRKVRSGWLTSGILEEKAGSQWCNTQNKGEKNYEVH